MPGGALLLRDYAEPESYPRMPSFLAITGAGVALIPSMEINMPGITRVEARR